MKNLCILLAALIVLAMPAFAQTDVAAKQDIDTLARAAHSLLPKAKTSDGQLIGEEKAKTLIYPLVPREMIEFIIKRGHVAGFAEHCGMDWQKQFYAPLMGFLRQREKGYTDYQWAYVGILHGVAMQNAAEGVAGKPCDPQVKANLMKEAK